MPQIDITGLSKTYGHNKVLRSLDLRLGETGIVAVLGPNGSGKTTLIKCILGLVIPDKGSIKLNGEPIINTYAFRNEIGYLPQIARFPENLTVKELLNILIDIRGGDQRRDQLIHLFELDEFLDKKMINLSGGTIQKVNITCAFMFDSPLLFLDEPTAGLDPVSLLKFKRLLKREKERGKLIILTTHILGLVEEIADQMIYLLNGKPYFQGLPSEMLRTYGGASLEHAIASLLGGSPLPTKLGTNGQDLLKNPKAKRHV